MTPTEEIVETKTVVATPRLKLTRTVKSGMFDTPEYVAVAAASALLLAVILSYFFVLIPAREDVKRRETERVGKEKELQMLQAGSDESTIQQTDASARVASVDRFETNFLSPVIQGNTALYGRLNELIRANGLRNTAGPEYAPLEVLAPGRTVEQKASGRAALQSLYPGTFVTVTVEGNYANLRRFIADIENSRQFLVINAVEIESDGNGGGTASLNNNNDENPITRRPEEKTASNFPPGMPNPNALQSNKVQTEIAPKPRPAIKTRGGGVSLRLEMAAYFRRPQTASATNVQN